MECSDWLNHVLMPLYSKSPTHPRRNVLRSPLLCSLHLVALHNYLYSICTRYCVYNHIVISRSPVGRASYTDKIAFPPSPIYVEKSLLMLASMWFAANWAIPVLFTVHPQEELVLRTTFHIFSLTQPLLMSVSIYFYCPILHGFPGHSFHLHVSHVVTWRVTLSGRLNLSSVSVTILIPDCPSAGCDLATPIRQLSGRSCIGALRVLNPSSHSQIDINLYLPSLFATFRCYVCLISSPIVLECPRHVNLRIDCRIRWPPSNSSEGVLACTLACGNTLTGKFRYFDDTSIAFPDAGQYICWVTICILSFSHSRMSHHVSRSPRSRSLFSLEIR